MVITEYQLRADIDQNLTFAFVSDLHNCDNKPILEAIRVTKVDAVLVGGDFIHTADIFEKGMEFLQTSAKTAPTFCSIGNHERRFDGDLLACVIAVGAIPLDNTALQFKGINIGGLSSAARARGDEPYSLKERIPNLSWLQEYSQINGYKILLCHHPEYYDKYIRNYPIDLTLSGHAHGGQWRFFDRGVYAPGQGLFPKYTAGIYENRLIVGRGLGNAHLIPRINNKPELLIIKLLKK